MPSTVSYNSMKLEPAPLVSVSKTYQKTEDTTLIGSIFNITLHGTLVAYMGSPDENGTFYTGTAYVSGGDTPVVNVVDGDARLSAIFRKQEAIRDLFSVEGQLLEIQGADASQPLKANVRVNQISFQEDIWFNVCRYTIELEADVVSVNGIVNGEDSDIFSYYLESASETWNFETLEQAENEFVPQIFRATHTISAKGKRFYDETGTLVRPAWQEARRYVADTLAITLDSPAPSAILDLPIIYRSLNHVRGETLDELGGTYSVTESWILASGLASEDFTVTTNIGNDDGLIRVNIQGDIQGFEERNTLFEITSTKGTNSDNKFMEVSGVALLRAQNYSGHSLNVVPKVFSVGKNPIAGTVSYSYEFDNRPSNQITGAKTESISVSDSFGVDIFAAIPVLDRVAGPVFQDINTSAPKTRSLNIEVVMENPGPDATFLELYNSSPFIDPIPSTDIQTIVNSLIPVANSVFVSQQNTNWQLTEQRGNLSLTWTYGD